MKLALSINGTPIPVPTGITNITADFLGQNIFQTGIAVLISIAVFLSFIFFIIGGLMWITSEGNKEKIQSAKNTLTYTIIGLIVVFIAFLIINIIQQFFGIQTFSPKSSSPDSSQNCKAGNRC